MNKLRQYGGIKCHQFSLVLDLTCERNETQVKNNEMNLILNLI